MFAIINFKGKQHKLEEGKEYRVDLIDQPETEKKVVFSDVLLIDDGKIQIGSPSIKGATVEAEIMGRVRSEKVHGLKFRPKKHYLRTYGHKEDYTVVKVTAIKA